MKKYNGDWKLLQGQLYVGRIKKLPDCLEKDHLFEIIQMLIKEGFDPFTFYLHEYPIEGVYICCQEHQDNYFSIQELDGKLVPHYTTEKMNKDGYNNFPCATIKESIEKMEC